MVSVTPMGGSTVPRVAEKVMVLPAKGLPSESRVAVNVRLPPEVIVKFSGVRLSCVGRLG
ncbi:MAG: hypothetical protein QXK94_10845 [Candidatus Jordarchaeales archaeon]